MMPPPIREPDVSDAAATGTPAHTADHLPIARARDLLDWLEGHGVRAREVLVEDDGTMTVRWAA